MGRRLETRVWLGLLFLLGGGSAVGEDNLSEKYKGVRIQVGPEVRIGKTQTAPITVTLENLETAGEAFQYYSLPVSDSDDRFLPLSVVIEDRISGQVFESDRPLSFFFIKPGSRSHEQWRHRDVLQPGERKKFPVDLASVMKERTPGKYEAIIRLWISPTYYIESERFILELSETAASEPKGILPGLYGDLRFRGGGLFLMLGAFLLPIVFTGWLAVATLRSRRRQLAIALLANSAIFFAWAGFLFGYHKLMGTCALVIGLVPTLMAITTLVIATRKNPVSSAVSTRSKVTFVTFQVLTLVADPLTVGGLYALVPRG